jgi:shikimate kinase
MNLYLIGYRGTGKTTLGKQLAEKLGWRFVDSDDEVVKSSGMTIRELVEKEGWLKFREIERQTIKRIGKMEKCIVATGGGVILDPTNISKMQASGKVVWLKANPETIKERLLNDSNTENFRPALTEKGLDAEIVDTLTDREPLYKKATDFEFDTDDIEIGMLCEYILNALELSGSS